MTAGRLLSQRAYAKQLGVQPAYINRLVKQGRIPLVDGKVDPRKADAAIARTQVRAPRRRIVAPAPVVVVAPAAPSSPMQPAAQSAAVSMDVEEQDANDEGSLTDARTRRERTLARNAELDLRERLGELVEVARVQSFMEDMVVEARDAFLGIADRLHARLAAESDARACYKMIRDEAEAILYRLSDRTMELIEECEHKHRNQRGRGVRATQKVRRPQPTNEPRASA